MKLPRFSFRRSPSKKSTTHGLKRWKEELDAERTAGAAAATTQSHSHGERARKRASTRMTRSRSSLKLSDRADTHMRQYRDSQQVAAMSQLYLATPTSSSFTATAAAAAAAAAAATSSSSSFSSRER